MRRHKQEEVIWTWLRSRRPKASSSIFLGWNITGSQRAGDRTESTVWYKSDTVWYSSVPVWYSSGTVWYSYDTDWYSFGTVWYSSDTVWYSYGTGIALSLSGIVLTLSGTVLALYGSDGVGWDELSETCLWLPHLGRNWGRPGWMGYGLDSHGHTRV